MCSMQGKWTRRRQRHPASFFVMKAQRGEAIKRGRHEPKRESIHHDVQVQCSCESPETQGCPMRSSNDQKEVNRNNKLRILMMPCSLPFWRWRTCYCIISLSGVYCFGGSF